MATYSRARSRSDFRHDAVVQGFYTYSNGAVAGTWSASNVQTWSDVRFFNDNPSSSDGHVGRYSATPCYDLWARADLIAPLQAWWSSDGGIHPTGGAFPLPDGVRTALVGDFLDRVGPPVGSILHRMMTRLLVQLPPEVSLGNFLAEARESALLLPQLALDWERFVQMKRPENTAFAAADTSLWWQFGAAPLLSDLETITQLGNRVGAKLESLRKWNGRVSNRRVGPWRGPDVLPAVRPWFSVSTGWPYGSNNDLQAKLASVSTTYRANCRLDSALEGLDEWDGITAAWLAATGLNNPLAVVYEALPFTFVLDWFAPVGDRLQRVGAKPIAGRWDLTDFCWSRLAEAKYELQIDRWVSTSGVRASYPVGTVTVREFTRDIVFPDFPFNWPLTAGQAELGLALALGASH